MKLSPQMNPAPSGRPSGIRAAQAAPRAARPPWLRPCSLLSAAGVGAGRGVSLLGRRQRGGLERCAVENVTLADLETIEPVTLKHRADDDRAGDDHGRTLGLEARELAPLREWERGQALELGLDRLTRDAVAVDPLCVVLAELKRGEGGDRARYANRLLRLELGERVMDGTCGGLELLARGWIGVEEALGQTDTAQIEA